MLDFRLAARISTAAIAVISYIVPSYNQGGFIKYTLDSILQNMAAGDQLIIADGASKDGTANIVRPYLADPRIEWFSEPDRGFSDAVTKAFRRIRNPIVGIMSSDDAYMPNIRDRVLAHFSDPAVALAYADYELIDVNNEKIGERRHGAGTLADVLSLRVLLPQSSVFFRFSVLGGQAILAQEHDYIADVVLFNQICLRGKFSFSPEIWSQVRKHGGSRTGKRNPGEQYLHAIDTVFAEVSPELKKKARAGGLLLQARYNASSHHKLHALRAILSATKLDPTVLSHWLMPRTLAFLLLGPTGIRILEPVRRRVF